MAQGGEAARRKAAAAVTELGMAGASGRGEININPSMFEQEQGVFNGVAGGIHVLGQVYDNAGEFARQPPPAGGRGELLVVDSGNVVVVAAPPTMTDPGSRSRVTTTGFGILLLAVSVGVGSGKFGLLIGLVGVLVGANLVNVGIRRMGEEPATPTGPASLRCNLPVPGIILASSAVTAVPGDARGSRITATGFGILLLAVSVGVGSRGGIGLLLALVGVLAGATTIAVGCQTIHC